MEQLNIFNVIAEANKPEPLFEKGDTVFILELDVVLRGTIDRSWICGSGDQQRYYGYSVDYDKGGHTAIWDHLIGKTVFVNERDAYKEAQIKKYGKLTLNEDMINEFVSFGYVRGYDNHQLCAAVGKIGETQLYEHDYICYRFVRQYPNTKKRDEAYRAHLKKVTEETQRYQGAECKTYHFEPLYKVTNELYASRGYALHNMRI